jgi:hypothetical protein
MVFMGVIKGIWIFSDAFYTKGDDRSILYNEHHDQWKYKRNDYCLNKR